MAKKVLKFGGTSVGTIERILHVAKIIKKDDNNLLDSKKILIRKFTLKNLIRKIIRSFS